MKIKLEPYMDEVVWDKPEVRVPNVYDLVETEEGEVLIRYHDCGSHACYVSPKVLACLRGGK